jgi:hypothetical protein
MENPYQSPVGPSQQPQPIVSSGTLITFAAFNFGFAMISLIWVIIMACVLVYGVRFSGDTGGELAAGVIGAAVFALPGLFGVVVFLGAGWGLLQRRIWGYYLHLVGAALACVTCIGLVYGVIALVLALRPEFSAALKTSKTPTPANPWGRSP